jgi:putative restriction endonuclease
MHPFIALSDWNWFHFFSSRPDAPGPIDEANFWQPKAVRPMANLSAGTPVFFRLKKPRYAIAGYGFYANFVSLRIKQAWEFFGTANGDATFEQFVKRIAEYRKIDPRTTPPSQWSPVGCTVLRDCIFWPQDRWIPWNESEGWATNIVQGKAERDPIRASRLLAEIQYDVPEDLSLEPFELVDEDERERVTATQVVRRGQGSFRSRLLETYSRRCAITGEHTEIVLDAAHIQRYLGPRSNHVQNGLLLTKEFHALFDEGYATVTPDYRVKISGRLRDEWENGHRYYPFDNRPLLVMPDAAQRPSREALEWHGREVFLG